MLIRLCVVHYCTKSVQCGPTLCHMALCVTKCVPPWSMALHTWSYNVPRWPCVGLYCATKPLFGPKIYIVPRWPCVVLYFCWEGPVWPWILLRGSSNVLDYSQRARCDLILCYKSPIWCVIVLGPWFRPSKCPVCDPSLCKEGTQFGPTLCWEDPVLSTIWC